MTHQQDVNDDEIIQDGQVIRVSLSMMDSLDDIQRSVAKSTMSTTKLTDGRGNPAGHRPGIVFTDAVDPKRKDAIKAAYDEYDHDLCTAYQRHIPTVVQRDPMGREKSTFENAGPLSDTQTFNVKDAQARKDAAYTKYEADLLDAWRK